MKKIKNFSLIVLVFSLLFVGIISKTNITQVTSELIQKNDANVINYLNISKDTVALMDNYMPNAKVTLYSGLKVFDITIKAESKGIVQIGTAKIEDVVEARTNGTAYTSNTKSYNVEAGENTITLNLSVKDNETLVIGGNNSVPIGYYPGINTIADTVFFSLIDGKKHDEVLNKTKGIEDALSIQVNVQTNNITNIESAIPKASEYTGDVATYSASNPASAPWSYATNITAFENKTLHSVRIPLTSVKSITENPLFTVSVLSKYTISSENMFTANESDVRVKYQLEIPLSEVEGAILDTTSASGTTSTRGEYVVNKWITLDLSKYNIYVNEGETVVFGDLTDTVRLAFLRTDIKDLNFYGVIGYSTNPKGVNPFAYLADVKVADVEVVTLEQHIEKLKQKEEIAKRNNDIAKLKSVLKGKNFSLLGDSISTYNGYSNNTQSNSTLTNNVFRYDDKGKAKNPTVPFTSVNETWWMQTANATGMNLLVNNSWAGSEVFGERTGSNGVHIDGAWEERCVQLHDDVGENAGTNPDIIAVYLGINDYNFNRNAVGAGEIDFDKLIISNGDGTYKYATPTEFKDAYAIMIHKMLTKYDKSQILIFTLLPEDMYSINKDSWNLHNKYIRDVANHFNLPIVDLADNSGITWSNMHDYLHTDKIHPNESGMDVISDTLVDKLIELYVNNENTENNNQNDNQNNNESKDEIKNPFTSTSLIKIISLILIVGSIIVLISTFKNTKINKYE